MVKTQSNARRFINAYNEIDYAIRVQHGFKRSMSFSEVIRKAVPLNYVVRKYEDELVDFGRLRNAIIHQSNDDYVIAEPHDDVVAEIEHISNLITTPPKAIEAVIDKNVLCVQYDVMLRDVVELIATSEYSNIPVYKNGGLIGIANGQRILDEIGKQVAQKVDIDDYLSTTTIESVVQKHTSSKYYDVVSRDATIEEVLNIFNENRKLIAILITKGGSLNEPPIGILTATDIISLNKILENY